MFPFKDDYESAFVKEKRAEHWLNKWILHHGNTFCYVTLR
jgi:hypothetical protein